MNDKTKWIIITIIFAILLVFGLISYIYANTTSKDDTPTITEQCTISNPTWCEELIEWLWTEYNTLAKQQAELSKKADVYRAIQKLWTGTTETWDFQ